MNKQRMYAFSLVILIAVLTAFICGKIVCLVQNPEISQEVDSTSPQKSIEECQTEAEALLQNMSLREKICQMMIVTPEALSGGTNDTVLSAEMQTGMEQYPVGGVVLFSRNIVERTQTQALLKGLQDTAKIKLFTAVDEEGGSVSRIGANSEMKAVHLPDMASIGASGDVERAEDAGYLIGTELLQLGFNLDFAPVADVYSNVQNPVIGGRAFSSDPQMAAKMVEASVKGFQKSGVLCTLKHFPGHGDASADSHSGTAAVNKSIEEIEACELIPFKEGINAGAPLVMVGHLTYPVFDAEKPASLSYNIVTGLLRNQLNYQGLIITDSLQMVAAANYETAEKCAALQAVEAGCDLLLMPNDLEAAVNQIIAAVQSGEIQESRIDESVRRILIQKIHASVIY